MQENMGYHIQENGYHNVHCPRCGRLINATELAFDFGAIINKNLEKQKNRFFGGRDDWYDLTRFNLCLYLTLGDLNRDYGFREAPNGTYFGRFEFTAEKLAQQIMKLALSKNPNFSLDILMNTTNIIEYQNLTDFMAKNPGEDRSELANRIQDLCVRIMRDSKDVIAAFDVEVRFEVDDRGNYFANKLSVEYDDRKKEMFTRFVCAGERGIPCGKVLFGHAGRYKEIIIGLAGTARVGKTAYLASLLASIMRQGDGVGILGHDQDAIVNIAYVDKSYKEFQNDLIIPYVQGKKIKKTENIKEGAEIGADDKEAVPLFSLTFCVNKRNYIFTFIDMPGEVYDPAEDDDNQDLINNRRRIIQSADAIWLCIAPAQIDPVVGNFGSEKVNTDLMTAFSNIDRTMSAINKKGKIPTAVLITRSDEAEEKYGICNKNFNPFSSPSNPWSETINKNENSPWVRCQDGKCILYYDNMRWFNERAYRYLSLTPALPHTIFNTFGAYTPFAVASYGRQIDTLELQFDGFDTMITTSSVEKLPEPSMIEGPFLWTLGMLRIIPVFVEKPIVYERKKFLRKAEQYTVIENRPLEINEMERIFLKSR